MDKKINILFTIPNFKTAGSQYVLKAIYNGLDKDRFKAYILVEKYPSIFPDEIKKEAQLYIPKGKSKRRYIARLVGLLKDYKIDILHSWDYRPLFLEAISCKLSGVHYIYTKKNNAWSKRWFLKSILSSYIAYDNPKMYERFFMNYWLKDKVTFIPHGVNTKLFTAKKVQTYSNTFNIGSIGNINANKNQLFILKALLLLPENVKVCFFGNEDADYRLKLNRFIQKHQLMDRVTFDGFVENKEIPRVMKQFDLFILASFNEGLPLCILEAMACGIPVLSSDSGGGARYIFENNQGGYIFNLENVSELVEQIKMFLKMDSNIYQEFTEKGVKRINENFTIESEVNGYTKLYLQLC